VAHLSVREEKSGVWCHVNDMWGPLVSFQKATVVSPNDFQLSYSSHLTTAFSQLTTAFFIVIAQPNAS
jgi:hypothetical protein